MTIYVVTIVEIRLVLSALNLKKMLEIDENPEEDYEDITWTNCDIEETT